MLAQELRRRSAMTATDDDALGPRPRLVLEPERADHLSTLALEAFRAGDLPEAKAIVELLTTAGHLTPRLSAKEDMR
jgi:hypothetical protein